MRFKNAIILFVFSAVAICGAQSSAPEKQSSANDFSKEAYVVEHLSTKVEVGENAGDVREVSAEVKILADAGVKALAVLNFAFTSADEVVEVDYVRVRKPDGTVVKTPDYNIQDMPAEITRSAPMYSDVREKHVAVKGLGVGDVLEYKIRFRTQAPQVPGQFWFEHSFSKSEIVRDERLELSFPKDKHFAVKSPDFKPEITVEHGRKIYRWKYSCLAREEKDEEAQSPLRALPPPSIQVSTFANWQELGRWYAELQKDQIAVTPAIAAKAKELTRNLSTDDEKLQAIYRFVSLNIHYVGLDFGIGRFQPHSAEDVLSNEYGDCKDKHTLLAALLKAQGFEAWPALIHASRKLDVEIPSLAQFNHVITVVPLGGGKLLWLDTTPEVAPYGLLMPVLRGKQALVMPSGKDAMLATIPANSPFPQVQNFTVTAKLGADGVLKGHIEQKYRGDGEVIFRTVLRQTSQANWKELLQRVSQGLGFAGDVSNVAVAGLEDLSQPLVFSYDYLRKDYADWENRKILAALPPFGIESAANKNQKPPKEPLYLGAVGELLFHSEIELPAGSSLTPAKDLNLVEPSIEYHSMNVLEKGVLKTTRRLNLKKDELPLNEWESYTKLTKSVSDDEFNYLALTGLEAECDKEKDAGGGNSKFEEGVNALQRRDSKGAQELFEQVIAADPKYPGAHLNLGVALLAQNRTEDALKELRKEEELSPDDAKTAETIARLCMWLKRGGEAIPEWRRVLKSDPKNRDAALALAQLLSADGKYAEAAESLENAVQLSPDSPNLQLQLGAAYMKSGNTEKALPHLRIAANESGTSKSVDAMMLNNIAYTLADANAEPELAKGYAEKALAELDTRSHADTNRTNQKLASDFSMVWDTAGWVYFRLGDYARAESYIRASWLLRQHSVVAEHLGQVYEKLGKTPEAAHTYELAYAAAAPSVGIRGRSPIKSMDEYEATKKRIAGRYQKLTGKTLSDNPMMKRLPGGRSVSPAEELSRMRDATFSHQAGPYGSAEFDLTFAAGKPPIAVFASGDEKLKVVKARLEAAKFKIEFPVGSNAVLVRHATVFCGQYAPCDAVMIPME